MQGARRTRLQTHPAAPAHRRRKGKTVVSAQHQRGLKAEEEGEHLRVSWYAPSSSPFVKYNPVC